MPLPQPDPELLRRAQRGDEHAFTVIVRAYETPVTTTSSASTGDRALAEDLTQEVFVRVYHGAAALLAALQVHDLAVPGDQEPRARRAARARAPAAVGVELDDDAAARDLDQPAEPIETIEAIWRAIAGAEPRPEDGAAPARRRRACPTTRSPTRSRSTLATVKWRIFKAREEVQLALARDGFHVGERPPTAAVAERAERR